MEKGYCRFSSSECHYFKLVKGKPSQSFCGKTTYNSIISCTTPKGGSICSPSWCPKLKKR